MMAPAADDDEAIPAPPEGYRLQTLRGPFSQHNGPYFEGADGEGARQAFYVLSRHCNGAGYTHGGMLSAFMDGLLAHAVGKASGAAGVTIHLSIDFLAPARRGRWVFGEARVSRLTQELAFAEARLHSGGHDLVRGSGVFKLHRRKAD